MLSDWAEVELDSRAFTVTSTVCLPCGSMSGMASVEALPTMTRPEEGVNDARGWRTATSPVFSKVMATSTDCPAVSVGISERLAMSVGAGEGAGVESPPSGWVLPESSGTTASPPPPVPSLVVSPVVSPVTSPVVSYSTLSNVASASARVVRGVQHRAPASSPVQSRPARTPARTRQGMGAVLALACAFEASALMCAPAVS